MAVQIIDGLMENRKNIADESIDQYDSMVDDIANQFGSQGVEVDIDYHAVRTDQSE